MTKKNIFLPSLKDINFFSYFQHMSLKYYEECKSEDWSVRRKYIFSFSPEAQFSALFEWPLVSIMKNIKNINLKKNLSSSFYFLNLRSKTSYGWLTPLFNSNKIIGQMQDSSNFQDLCQEQISKVTRVRSDREEIKWPGYLNFQQFLNLISYIHNCAQFWFKTFQIWI